MKLAMLGFEAAGGGLRCCVCWRWRTAARAELLIYAWNPLPVWAFAGNGHVDAVGGRVCLRWRCCCGCAGATPGRGSCWVLAVLTKFLPAVIAPALWRRGAGWRLALAAAATMLVLYAAYSGVGWRVLRVPARLWRRGRHRQRDRHLAARSGSADLVPLPAGFAASCCAWRAGGLLAGLGAWCAFAPARRMTRSRSARAARRSCWLPRYVRASPRIIPGISPGSRCRACLAPLPSVLWLSPRRRC